MKNEQKIVSRLWVMIALAFIMTIAGAIIAGINIIEEISTRRDSGNNFAEFMAGFSIGITWVSFLVVLIMIYNIAKNIHAKRVFSANTINHCQTFACIMTLAGVSNNVSVYVIDGISKMNFQVIIFAILILIIAQLMKLGYKTQQEQELTI